MATDDRSPTPKKKEGTEEVWLEELEPVPTSVTEAPSTDLTQQLDDELQEILTNPQVRPSEDPKPPPRTSAPPVPRPSRPLSVPPASAAPSPSHVPPPQPADPLSKAALALIRSCEIELAASPSPESQRVARLHYEIARMYETPIRDFRKAAMHYQQALEHSPEMLPAIQGARRVLLARKSYQSALPWFDAEARIMSDPKYKAGVYLAKGRILEDALGKRREARQAYMTALDLDRANPSILKAVEQSDLDEDGWDSLLKTYERAANAVASDPNHRAALVVQKARVLESRKSDLEGAIELYETALKLDPHNSGAAEALKRLHFRHRRWRDLIRILRLEAEQATDPEVRALAWFRIGRLHAEQLGSRDEALSALEQALGDAPTEPLLLEEIARLYETSGRHTDLVRVLEQLVKTTEEPDERLALLHRVGQLHEEKLGDTDQATRCYEAALQIRPTYLPALQALGNLYRQREQWDPLVRMHLAEIESSGDPRRRASAHARIAEIFESHLEKQTEAADHHAKALALVRGYAPSFKALCRILAETKRWHELIDLYEQAIEDTADSDRVITYLFKIGAIYEDALHEHGQAAHAYRRILELRAQDLGAIHALQRATERAGRYQELVEALELEAERTRDPQQVVALLHRAGEVLDEKLEDRDGALIRFRKVLAVNPKYVPALTSLGRLYYRTGRWEDLLEMYKRELELTPSGPVAVALLHKMAELCEEKIGRDEEAVEYYQRALQIDPAHAPVLRALARKLREREQWDELAKILDLEWNGLGDPHAKARTAFRIGEVAESHLNQPDRAIAAYEQALKAVPDYRPAIDALSRLRAEKHAWAKLADELEREANSSSDPALTLAAWMRQGDVWAHELGEPRRAIACYEKVLQRHPNYIPALLTLESLYRRVGSWDLLAQVYEAQARAFSDPAAKTAALRELVRIHELRNLGSVDDRKNIYERILQISPEDPLALEALQRLSIEHGEVHLLADISARLAAQSNDPMVTASHLTRVGEALESQSDPSALDMYRRALELDVENLSATRGLSRLAQEADDPAALAQAARLEANVSRDKDTAANLLVQSAKVRIERLGDEDGAATDLERALELTPDNGDAAAGLRELLSARGQHARLADLLSRAANETRSLDRAAALWNDVAHLQANSLNNVPGAIASLTRVLRSQPNHLATLRNVSSMHARANQWVEAAQYLSKVVQLAPDRQILKDAHLELASIWHERLQEPARAISSLQAVLALDASNYDALARLSDVHAQDGKIRQAIDTALRLIEVSKTPQDRAVGLVRLARLEQARDNMEGANTALLEAIALDGPGSEAALEWKSVVSTAEGWNQYVQSLRRYLRQPGITAQASSGTYLEVSRVLYDQLKQSGVAFQSLEEALRQHPTDTILRLEIAERARTMGNPKRAVFEYQALLANHGSSPEIWRSVHRTFMELKKEAEARWAAAALVVLGQANTSEQAYAHKTRPLPLHGHGLDAEILRSMHSSAPPEIMACELVSVLEEALEKLYPVPFESYGVSTRDKITPKSNHPSRQIADEIAAALGVQGFDLYIHQVRGLGIITELSHPPSILIPAAVTELRPAQQRFLLARPLTRIAQGLHAVDRLMPRELEVLVASACRIVEPAFGRGLTSEEVLDGQSKKVQRSLSRRARKSLEEIASRYVRSQRVDFPRWTDRILFASDLAAAVLADDLPSVIEVLRYGERESSSTGQASARSTSVDDILRFWMSETSLYLRKNVGLSQ